MVLQYKKTVSHNIVKTRKIDYLGEATPLLKIEMIFTISGLILIKASRV